MHEPQLAHRIFFAIQAIVLLAAMFTLDHWGVFRGIIAAQAGLVGVWLGVGQMQRKQRLIAAAAAAALFALVMVALALNFKLVWLLSPNGFGWQFLLLMARVLFVAGVFWQALGRDGYVLMAAGEPMQAGLLRFRLHHLVALMGLVALYLVVTQNLDGGPFYQVLLVVYVALMGLAYAANSLLASLMALEPKWTPGRIIAYGLSILAISLAIAGHAYHQTDNWNTARRTWLETMIEVAWLGGSLAVLRMPGMRLVRLPGTEPAPAFATDDGSTSATHAPWFRFNLKAMFVVFTLVAIWLGWNVSIVQQRKHLRALIDDRPASGGTMAVITAAEGNAAAPKAVKDQIAPHVIEAFQIRNRGGTTIGPRSGGDLSLLRRWLGDELVFIILLDDELDIREEVESTFPEAMIVIREADVDDDDASRP
jgi:hypothetical protein